jgi:hypothetical protein
MASGLGALLSILGGAGGAYYDIQTAKEREAIAERERQRRAQIENADLMLKIQAAGGRPVGETQAMSAALQNIVAQKQQPLATTIPTETALGIPLAQTDIGRAPVPLPPLASGITDPSALLRQTAGFEDIPSGSAADAIERAARTRDALRTQLQIPGVYGGQPFTIDPTLSSAQLLADRAEKRAMQVEEERSRRAKETENLRAASDLAVAQARANREAQQKSLEFERDDRAAYKALQDAGKIPKDLDYATAKIAFPNMSYAKQAQVTKELAPPSTATGVTEADRVRERIAEAYIRSGSAWEKIQKTKDAVSAANDAFAQWKSSGDTSAKLTLTDFLRAASGVHAALTRPSTSSWQQALGGIGTAPFDPQSSAQPKNPDE